MRISERRPGVVRTLGRVDKAVQQRLREVAAGNGRRMSESDRLDLEFLGVALQAAGLRGGFGFRPPVPSSYLICGHGR